MSFLDTLKTGMKESGAGDLIASSLVKKITDFATNVLPKLWQNIVNWFIKSVKYALDNDFIEGFKFFVKNAGNSCVEILAQYYLEGDQWYKKETTTKISENEVPPEILARARAKRNQNIDATPELKEKLELCC